MTDRLANDTTDTSPTNDARGNEADAKPRLMLQFGAFGLVSGIAISVLGLPQLGAWITAASAAGLLFGLHTFGRLGSDRAEPTVTDHSFDTKKRKKKRKSASVDTSTHTHGESAS